MQLLGDYLKEQREEKGIRLEEIASITKIHIQSLRHIENGRWEKLPPEPFIRGFITAYAKYVGVEPAEAIQRYAHETLSALEETSEVEDVPLKHKTLTKQAPPPTAISDSEQAISHSGGFALNKKSFLGTIAGVVVIGVVIFVLNAGKQSDVDSAVAAKTAVSDSAELSEEELTALLGDSSERDREPAEKAEKTSKIPEPKSSGGKTKEVVAASTPKEATPTPTPNKHAIQVQSGERSWIKVVVDDKEPIEYFLNAGKKVFYTAEEKIKVVIGNAEGAEVLYNGDKVSGIKYRSGVHAFIYPRGSQFPQDVPPARPTASEKDKDQESTTDSMTDTGLEIDLE